MAIKRKQELQKETAEKEKQIENIKSAVADLRNKVDNSTKQIGDLKTENSKLSDSLLQQEKELQKTATELVQSRQEREDANRKIELYEEQKSLTLEKKEIEAELSPLEKKRRKSFKNLSPILCMIGGWGFFVGGVLVMALVLLGWLESWAISIFCAEWSASWFFFNRKHALEDKENERANKEYAKWEAKNPRYNVLVSKLDKLDKRLEGINAEMKEGTRIRD